MTADFIDDGYTEQGFIAAVDGVHGPLEFEFRPALVKTADKITGMIQGERVDWERFADAAAKALARDPGLLKGWSLKDSKGNAVQITEPNLLRVRNQLFHKLWMIVAGQVPSERRSDDTQPPQVNLEADEKN
ncbi:MAG: hypothetical protein L0211_09165 [Planctomycetaceae bacterium]|nr:hypothetical protein [Planctomycetaceae bacterium]